MLSKDYRPYLSVRAQIFKYYKSKVSGKLLLSKNPMFWIDTEAQGTDTCRESVSSWIKKEIFSNLENQKVKGGLYIPMTYASRLVNNKIVPAECIIGLEGGIEERKLLGNKSNLDELKKVVEYMAGIPFVCMIHTKSEASRRKHIGKAGKLSYIGGRLSYKTLSPYILTSPVTISIALGMVRDSLNIVASGEDVNKHLFKKVPFKRVCDVINTCDYKEAGHIFDNIVLPYWEKLSKNVNNDDSHIFYTPRNLRIVRDLISKGCDTIFSPRKVYNYYHELNTHYGIYRFAQGIESARNTYNRVKEI